MTIRRSWVLVLLCGSLVLGGCRANNSFKESLFASLFSECSMNSAVVFLPSQPELRIDGDMVLDYRNESQDEIAFPASSGVSIYFFDTQSQSWQELNNEMRYATGPEGYFIVGASSDELSSHHIVEISPELPQNKPREIRVAVIGHIFRDGKVTDECVGAFVDIQP